MSCFSTLQCTERTDFHEIQQTGENGSRYMTELGRLVQARVYAMSHLHGNTKLVKVPLIAKCECRLYRQASIASQVSVSSTSLP